MRAECKSLERDVEAPDSGGGPLVTLMTATGDERKEGVDDDGGSFNALDFGRWRVAIGEGATCDDDEKDNFTAAAGGGDTPKAAPGELNERAGRVVMSRKEA